MSLFAVPFISSVVIQNTKNINRGIVVGVTVAANSTVTVSDPKSIKRLSDAYNNPSHAFKGLVDSGDLVVTVNSDPDKVVGAEFSGLMPKSVSFSIGVDGVSADENFVSAANITEQTIDLGAYIPAAATVLGSKAELEISDVAGTLSVDLGTASGGNQLASVGVLTNSGDKIVGGVVAPATSARNIWANVTPSVNWNLFTTGKINVSIAYIQI